MDADEMLDNPHTKGRRRNAEVVFAVLFVFPAPYMRGFCFAVLTAGVRICFIANLLVGVSRTWTPTRCSTTRTRKFREHRRSKPARHSTNRENGQTLNPPGD